MCEIAREMLAPPHHVGRVIARPFVGTAGDNFRRTENRRDYPLPARPTTPGYPRGGGQKGPRHRQDTGDLLRRITTAEQTTNNPDHIAALARALSDEGPGAHSDFVFANLEDFDMLYGHRNDPLTSRLLAGVRRLPW